MRKKLTISLEEDVYNGLHAVVGRRNISRFMSDLARPYVVPKALEEAYREMAANEAREAEALEWADGLLEEPLDE